MEEILKNIKALIFDVDGVMTDGGLISDADGTLYRVYNAKDRFGIRMAILGGYKVGCITGANGSSVVNTLKSTGIKEEDIYLLSRNKIEDFNDFCQRNSIKPEEVMYFGDDLPDLSIIKAAGIGACPCDAVDEVKEASDFVSTYPGGKSFIRNAIEMVMKAQGKWTFDVEGYTKKF